MPVPSDSTRPPLHAVPRTDESRITKRRSVLAPGRTEYVIRMPVGEPIVQMVPSEHVAAFEAASGLILAALDEHADAVGEHIPEIRLHA